MFAFAFCPDGRLIGDLPASGVDHYTTGAGPRRALLEWWTDMRISTVIAALAFSFLAVGQANAAGIGQAKAVIDAAGASGRIGTRPLAVGSEVFIGDTIATDTRGEGQILFADGTRMVVGQNVSLVIDDLVFRGGTARNTFMVEAKSGAFRFISSDGGDQNYAIRTPTAKIGVRGAVFDFTVTPSGSTRLVLLRGEATMCGDLGDCETTRSQCEMLITGAGQKVRKVAIGSELARELRDLFPYLTSQSTLLPPFRFQDHGCNQAAGGLSEFSLNQSTIRTSAAIAGGVAAAVSIGICVILCGGGGGSGGPAIDTNNGTN